MDDDDLLALFEATTRAVARALDGLDDWGLTGAVPGQHHSDLAADAAALDVLLAASVGVLSEESGRHAGASGSPTVVVDPLDGSTNAAQGIPWYATSLCAVDDAGPSVAMVTDQVTGHVFTAIRGRGAWRDGEAIGPSAVSTPADALVGLSGYPPEPLGWRQYRTLGAAALDLCLVASGGLDAFVDCSRDAHGPWDYLGGVLVCREAGAVVVDADHRELVTLDHGARRTPVAAATPALLEELVAGRRSWADRPPDGRL